MLGHRLAFPLLALLMLGSTCGTGGKLRPLPPHYNVEAADQVPVILLGQVIKDSHPVPPPGKSEWDGGDILLYSVRVKVEAVLRGKVPQKEVDIFYFPNLNAGSSPFARVMSDLYAGHSEMFFLQRDFGELRTICDGSRQCIFWVRSGCHYGFEKSLSLAYDIARVFLTRGDGASDEQMFDAIYHAEQRWGSEPVYHAMENLAKTDRSPAVRARALQRLATLRRQLPDGQ